MRHLKIFAIAASLVCCPGLSFIAQARMVHAKSTASSEACPSLLNQRVPRLQDDKPIDLCQYAGKVVLVVNTASYCGFTPQYKGLEALYRRFGPEGLVVLGFPSNDFHQEMQDSGKIAAFCQGTYGVQFPMFAPSHVTEPDPNSFYRKLISATGSQPKWNFYKYLIARDGKVVNVYSSLTTPENKTFIETVRTLLLAKEK